MSHPQANLHLRQTPLANRTLPQGTANGHLLAVRVFSLYLPLLRVTMTVVCLKLHQMLSIPINDQRLTRQEDQTTDDVSPTQRRLKMGKDTCLLNLRSCNAAPDAPN